jgi:hypothetical protein
MSTMAMIWDRRQRQRQRLGARFLEAQDTKTARRSLIQLEQLLVPHLERTLETQGIRESALKQEAQGRLHQSLSLLPEQGAPLPDLERLTESVAYEFAAQQLNERNPRRRQLQLLILYVLRNCADRFQLRKDPSGLLLTGMQKARRQIGSPRWSRLQAEPVALARPLLQGLDLQAADYLPKLLERLLGGMGHLVPVMPLVSVVAALNEVPQPVLASVDERLLLAEKIEAVYLLRQLWEELQTLPVRQRLILVLGARNEEGKSLLLLLTEQGIVSEAELAQALEIGIRSFPLLLRELPCDDERLAELVKLTPESVRHHRQSARYQIQTQLQLWGQGHPS